MVGIAARLSKEHQFCLVITFKCTGARLPKKAKYTFRQGVIYTEALCFPSIQRNKINLSYNQLG